MIDTNDKKDVKEQESVQAKEETKKTDDAVKDAVYKADSRDAE